MSDLAHHIYEIRKGVRRMALHTTSLSRLDTEMERIRSVGLACIALENREGRVNLVLGHPSCVSTVSSFGEQNLSRLTPEQDFMLGVMLGYDLGQQCMRYLGRKESASIEGAREASTTRVAA